MLILRALFGTTFALLLPACPPIEVGPFPQSPEQPEQPEQPDDPAPPAPTCLEEPCVVEGCSQACERLAELRCPSANPTPEGVSCVSVCRNVEDEGTVRVNTACIVRAQSCAEADEC